MISDSASEKLLTLADRLEARLSAIDDTVGEVQKLQRSSQTNRKLIIGLCVSLILDLLLTTAMGIGIIRINDNSNKTDKLAAEVNTEVTVQRVEALCPLYQLFVDADTTTSRAAAAARGDDMALRDKSFSIIHNSYDALRCHDFVGGAK